MSKYKISLGYKVTQGGTEFSGGDHYWTGIDDAALGKMLQHSDALLASVQSAASKGGPLSVKMTRGVTALDGGTVPANANGNQDFDGVTRAGLNEIETVAHGLGGELLHMGKAHKGK